MNPDPAYRDVLDLSGANASNQAKQILETTRPFRTKRDDELRVLDVGFGYGHVAIELARRCGEVVGLEPSPLFFGRGRKLAAGSGTANLELRNQALQDIDDDDAFDLIVLDNVLEHLPDQEGALATIVRALRPGGVLYLLVPNKLWPLEAHYGLPFLAYLPISMANWYLRATGRGTDYTDASYAPTYGRLVRLLRREPRLQFQFVLPADLSLTYAGGPWHYRIGAALIRRLPLLWRLSKSFLVVGVKGRVIGYRNGVGGAYGSVPANSQQSSSTTGR